MIPVVYFIACHGASADHFAAFIETIDTRYVNAHVIAAEQVAKKFEDKKIPVDHRFTLEDGAQEAIVAICSTAQVIITDVGHRFAETVQRAFLQQAPEVHRMAYYDNPETFVPGGYSQVAAAVMQLAHTVVFANANLVDAELYQEKDVAIDLSSKKKIGIGYYPIQQADAVLKRRQNERQAKRKEVLQKYGIEDTGQKIAIYFGGNNEEYFTKAFPAFLDIMSQAHDLIDQNYIFILQQHPAAKGKNLDATALAAWQIEHKAACFIVSDYGSDVMQVIGDLALYYQTSMGPQFLLAGIPTMQIGHETYEDVLVRNGLIQSVTSKEQFVKALEAGLTQTLDRKVLMQGLGINSNWPEHVQNALTKNLAY